MSSSLRQRQRREVLDLRNQEKENEKRISAVSKGASGWVQEVYVGLLLFLIFMVMARIDDVVCSVQPLTGVFKFFYSLISWFRPSLLPWNTKPVPKLVLASFFPS
jgi:hypothetical protein